MCSPKQPGPPPLPGMPLTAWEIHKDADALLHSRQNTFFVAQAFLITGFATIGASITKSALSLLIMALSISALGAYISVVYFFMARILLLRLLTLKKKLIADPIYNEYLFGAAGEFAIINDGRLIHRLLARHFAEFIPVALFLFWFIMAGAAIGRFYWG